MLHQLNWIFHEVSPKINVSKTQLMTFLVLSEGVNIETTKHMDLRHIFSVILPICLQERMLTRSVRFNLQRCDFIPKKKGRTGNQNCTACNGPVKA